MYSSLKPNAIIATIEHLGRRINERFPNAGLGKVNAELLELSKAASTKAQDIARPWLLVRIAEAGLVAALIGGMIALVFQFNLSGGGIDLPGLIQFLEATMNLVILLGAAIFTVISLEQRMKRARSLAAIHELRSIAHIIDMHQLTKDPERPLSRQNTPSSPPSNMTPFELRRYFDYCSEMLSLVSKVSALYVQRFSDPVVLDAVNDLESLTNGLSRKIWQKMMVLEMLDPAPKKP